MANPGAQPTSAKAADIGMYILILGIGSWPIETRHSPTCYRTKFRGYASTAWACVGFPKIGDAGAPGDGDVAEPLEICLSPVLSCEFRSF